MKNYLLILSFFLFTCSNPPPTENILSDTEFEDVLKQIHLSEAAFQLNKMQDIKGAKLTLKNNYHAICSQYKISNSDLQNNLNYYAKNPEKIEKIYRNLLEKLNKERSILDQQ